MSAGEERFALKWRKTYPDVEDDFLGKDPDNGWMYARVYRSNSFATDLPWYWTASRGNFGLGSGYAASVREAATKAEGVYFASA